MSAKKYPSVVLVPNGACRLFMSCSTNMGIVRVMFWGVLIFRSLSGSKLKINIVHKYKYKTKK